MTALARCLVTALAASAGSLTAVVTSSAQGSGCPAVTYQCAVADVERGAFEAAIQTLTVVLQRTPTRVDALHLLGVALTGADRIQEANARYAAAFQLDPRFYPAARNLGINHFNAGRVADARIWFVRVLERAPQDAIAHLHLGEIDHGAREYESAVAHYRKAGTLIDEHGLWLVHFGDSLLQTGQRSDGIATLERLPREDTAARFAAGLALGQLGAYREAATFFASARPGHADPALAAYNELLMLTKAEAYADAARLADTLQASGKTSAEFQHLASRAYLNLGRTQDATAALREAIRQEPSRAQAYVDLALLCLTYDDYDLGLEVVDAGLHYAPDSAVLQLHRGVLQMMRGEPRLAEQSFETARRLAPETAAPYTALAMVWMEVGRSDHAVRELREVRRRIDDPALSFAFALALIRTGADPGDSDDAAATEAVAALRASVAAGPNFAPAHVELGRLLLRRGDTAGAVAALERAVAIEPDNTAALYNLGQALRKAGQTSRAREVLEQVAALNAGGTAGGDQQLKELIFGVGKPRR